MHRLQPCVPARDGDGTAGGQLPAPGRDIHRHRGAAGPDPRGVGCKHGVQGVLATSSDQVSVDQGQPRHLRGVKPCPKGRL